MGSMVRSVLLVMGVFLVGLVNAAPLTADQIQIVTEDYYPYQYLKNGRVEGMATEIVREVLTEVRAKGEIRLLPWARAYHKALEEDNILIYSIARNQAREHLFKWVGTVAPYHIYFYKLKSRTDIVIHSLDDAKRYSIGGLYQDVRQQYLASKGFTNIVNVVKSALNIRKLYMGRIDLLPFDEFGFILNAKKMGLDPSKVEKIFFLKEISSNLYMAFSRKTDDAIVKEYRQALGRVKADGRYARIVEKFLK